MSNELVDSKNLVIDPNIESILLCYYYFLKYEHFGFAPAILDAIFVLHT